jgi:hypothetical protein
MIDIQINDLKNNNPSEVVNPDIYNEVPQLALAASPQAEILFDRRQECL